MEPCGGEGRLTEVPGHLTSAQRRTLGAYYTPSSVAGDLVAWAGSGWTDPPRRVLDPACGAGVFLLAAREAWPDAELVGLDIDPGAVEACRAALPGADVRLADGLDPLDGHGDLDPLDPLVTGSFDLVVGNPPFLGQLARATARDRSARARLRARFGPAASGYVDTAALFLLAGLDAVGPGGRVVLIQPESVLGAAHTGPLRRSVEARAEVVGLRLVDRRAFAAEVDACALLLERRPIERTDGVRPRLSAPSVGDSPAIRRERIDSESPTANRQRIDGWRFDGESPSDGPPTWSPLLARARGVPEVRLDPSAGTIADLATATAGFRQHHYALAAHAVEHAPGLARIATTGLVDPGVVRWGDRPARLGGRTWQRPAVDLTGIAADDPSVASWFRARLQPKVLVAPQTRVVEAAVDAHGAFVPATPLVTVEPRSDLADPDDLADPADPDDSADPADPADPDLVPWLVAAALSAPPVTAWALDRTAGTAQSRHALKLSARQVLTIPLPADRDTWAASARALRAAAHPTDVAVDMTVAYGLAGDDPVIAWWRDRCG